ncbi:hypothetical protein MVEN_01831000 [Mycena venus]|uniref:DUF6534 domain-containing protein n=1 Tax=Mycena venus TaxID=2733690 RepID=A0A8H6XJ10_9AGAR|nr:hypothetical protein MVEN_01831000 [Mycena venus]
MDSAAAVSFDANGTIGAYQIGVLISYVLLGVTTTQTYIYYSRFPEDPAILKALVAFVWVCEVAHAICIAHALYQFTILDFGNPERLFSRLPISLDVAIFFSALIEQSVLGFFSFRIYTLSKKLYVPILIVLVTSVRLLGSMVTFVVTLRLPSLQSYTAHWGWLSIAQWCAGVFNDVLTTAALVVLLYNQRTSAQRRTVALVDKIIVWTIETGMLTSASAIFMMIFYLTMKERMIWLAAFVVAARMYSNSLLASLNSREALRSMKTTQVSLQSLASRPGIEILQTTTTNAVVDITAKFPSQPQSFQGAASTKNADV